MRPGWVLDRRRGLRRRRTRAPGINPARRFAGACLASVTYPFTARSELAHFAGDSRRPLQFGRRDVDAIEAELYSHLTPVKRRLWVQRSLLLLCRAAVLIAGIQLMVAMLGFAAVAVPPNLVNVAMGIVGVVALFLVFQQRVTFADAARVLDRRLALDQVIGTGVELTQRGIETRMARLQVRRATDAVRRVESSEAIRLGLPVQDLRAFGALAVLTVAFLYLATLNIAWPGQPAPGDVQSDPVADMADVPYTSDYYEGDPGSALDPELFNSQLDDYQRDLENQNLNPEEMAARMAEIQQQLAQRAEALNKQRQALSDLADSLSDSSASSDAADSIRKGDYQKAAQQLGDLGKQSSQLSQRSRRDLAQKLAEAAKRVQPNNGELAQKMAKAAQQLAGSDQSGTEQAMNELGEGVQQAGDQMKQLQDSSSSFDPSQMDENGQSDLSAEELGGLSDFQGQGDQGDMDGAGADGQFGTDPNGSDMGSGGTQRADQAAADEASQGAAAGGGPSRDQYKAPTASGAAQSGKVLELRGRPTDSGGSTQDTDSRVPLVSSNDGTVQTTSGGARSVIVDPLTVRGEQNYVPWEKRQIVKDYFSGPGK
jgi:uncharacterized membrane protein